MRNTVFFGSPKFELKTYIKDRCGNVDGVKVAVCTNHGTDDNMFNCNWMGVNCYAEHSTSTGHLYFRDIKCF